MVNEFAKVVTIHGHGLDDVVQIVSVGEDDLMTVQVGLAEVEDKGSTKKKKKLESRAAELAE